MRVFVGSMRPAKVEGAREALAAIARVDPRFASVDLVAHDVTHIAPRMPMSAAAIIAGARDRATTLIAGPEFTCGHDIAIGLEGGLDPVTAPPVAGWALQSWAAVTDGLSWGVGAGPTLMLPAAVADRVANGEELGDVIDALAGEAVRGTRGAWGVLTRDLIGRRDAFRLAALAALAPFYNAPAWTRL